MDGNWRELSHAGGGVLNPAAEIPGTSLAAVLSEAWFSSLSIIILFSQGRLLLLAIKTPWLTKCSRRLATRDWGAEAGQAEETLGTERHTQGRRK